MRKHEALYREITGDITGVAGPLPETGWDEAPKPPKPATLSGDGSTAVDHNYFWLSMATCPRGVKVQLLGAGGVATLGAVGTNPDRFWRGWAPMPKVPQWMKDAP